MPNAGRIWETLLYGLAGTSTGPFAQRRDRLLAALREVGLDPDGAAALDEDALAGRPPHVLVIVAGDGADDDFTFAAVPEDALDADPELAAAVAALADETIDIGTPEDAPALWQAWARVALATGARALDELAELGPLGDDEARFVDRWAAYAFTPRRGGRLDGARLDLRVTRVCFVLERV
jgi:hypothetical protein